MSPAALERLPCELLASILEHVEPQTTRNVAAASNTLRNKTGSLLHSRSFALANMRLLFASFEIQSRSQFPQHENRHLGESESDDGPKHFVWSRIENLNFDTELSLDYMAALIYLTGFNRCSLVALYGQKVGFTRAFNSSCETIAWRASPISTSVVTRRVSMALHQILSSILDDVKPCWSTGHQNDIRLLLLWACAAGDEHVLSRVVAQCPNEARAVSALALATASGNGHCACMNLLMTHLSLDPSASNNTALIWAAKSGHVESVRVLLNDARVHPGHACNSALVSAARAGALPVVDMLLRDSRVHSSAQENGALVGASMHGHVAVVARLLRESPVADESSQAAALTYATLAGHADVVELLLAAGADPTLNRSSRSFQEAQFALAPLFMQYASGKHRKKLALYTLWNLREFPGVCWWSVLKGCFV
ncbi:hypothetical protein HDU81_003508 [Chytriomyces hyalinus]|nr:hypothetical protein HDU81_003508 [Chytriomyces hyalinus]